MRKTPKRSTRKATAPTAAPPPSIEDLVQLHAQLAEFNKHLVAENEKLVQAVKAAEEKPRQDLLAIVSNATEILKHTTKVMQETCNSLAAKERTLDTVLKETRERLTEVCLSVDPHGDTVTRSPRPPTSRFRP